MPLPLSRSFPGIWCGMIGCLELSVEYGGGSAAWGLYILPVREFFTVRYGIAYRKLEPPVVGDSRQLCLFTVIFCHEQTACAAPGCAAEIVGTRRDMQVAVAPPCHEVVIFRAFVSVHCGNAFVAVAVISRKIEVPERVCSLGAQMKIIAAVFLYAPAVVTCAGHIQFACQVPVYQPQSYRTALFPLVQEPAVHIAAHHHRSGAPLHREIQV